jgi:glutaredoxin
MKIKWNEVTWYSKLLAVILFTAVAMLFFYFGIQFQEIKQNKHNQDELDKYAQSLFNESLKVPKKNENNKPIFIDNKNKLNFLCDAGKKFSLEYVQVFNSPGDGEIYIPIESTVLYLKLENEIKEALKYYKTSNGGRINQYIDEDLKFLFETNSDKAFIKQNGVTTYKNCVVRPSY